MSVHYKFKSALTFDTITFDGLHISVRDLKKEILQQKQIGRTADFDLQITNAQTNEVYLDENTLIPKNSSLIVVRVPLTAQQKRAWERQEANQQLVGIKTNRFPVDGQDPGVQRLAKAVDLSSLDASEDDKIRAMMTQSTLDYDPSNYMHIRGSSQVGEVPSTYRCFKCHQPGHWIKDCRLGTSQEPIEIRKSTGIPRSFMVPVEGPSVPGAMMTPSGQFAVPSIDHQAYQEGKRPPASANDNPTEKMTIPEELVCSICQDLLTDTVMIPCCGNSFCDECIRTALLESENQQCPDCKEQGVSPNTLIPNRFLRTAVNSFRNQTGYRRAQTTPRAHHQQMPQMQVIPKEDMSIHGPPHVEQQLQQQKHPSPLLPTPPYIEPVHPPPTNSHHVIPPVQQIQPIPSLGPRPVTIQPNHAPVVDHNNTPIINLTQTPEHSNSPIQVIETIESTKGQRPPPTFPPTNTAYPPHTEKVLPITTTANTSVVPNIPPGELDAHRPIPHGPHSTEGHAQIRPAFPPAHRVSVEERSATPTVDERANAVAPSNSIPPTTMRPTTLPGNIPPTTTLPDTSIPPPGINPPQAYPILPIGPSMHPYGAYNPPPGGYPRGGPHMPPYSNMGPGFHPVDPRGGMRGYRPFVRGRPRGMHPYRGGSGNTGQAGSLDDAMAAFEKMLLEKEIRDRRKRRHRSYSRSRSRSRTRSRSKTPKSFSRTRSRSRSHSGSTRPRTRSRSRSHSRPVSHHKSRSLSLSPRRRTRSITRSRTRSRTRTRSRSRTRSRTPTKPRARSFTLSRSRSRSVSRSVSPRDRTYSPRRRDNARYRSPLSRTSPTRYPARYHKDYDNVHGYYDQDIRQLRGRGRGRFPRGRGANNPMHDYKDVYYSPSNTRFDTRYDTSRAAYHHQAPTVPPRAEQVQPQRYANRRYENFEVIPPPPGTGPDLPSVTSSATYRGGYQDGYLTPPGVGDHRIVAPYASDKRDSTRENVRELTARDWERTRDRELEQRERERQRESDDRYSYQKRQQSPSPVRDRHRKKFRESSKENKLHPVEAIEASLRVQETELRDEGRSRVLVDLKKEPSVEKEKKKDAETPPTKEKKKEKEKKKKKKEDGEKKKKKKKEKKEIMGKDKSDETGESETIGKIENVERKLTVPQTTSKIDPLYGDIEGTSVDQTVVENYGKVENELHVRSESEHMISPGTQEVKPNVGTQDTGKENVVLAPVPELSKWELDEDLPQSQEDKAASEDGSNLGDKKVVTSEVLKRAENAIFQKAINAIRPFDIIKKNLQSDKSKDKKEPVASGGQQVIESVVDAREARKIANSIQVTIPSAPARTTERSVEIAAYSVEADTLESTKVKKLDRSKFTPIVLPSTSPVRVSAKERLGAKVDYEDRSKDDGKRVRSAVERKSKSRSPRRYMERKVIEPKDKHREGSSGRDRRVVVSGSGWHDRERRISESSRGDRRHRDRDKRRDRRSRSSSRERKYRRDKKHREKTVVRKKDEKVEDRQVVVKVEPPKEIAVDKKTRKNPRLASDRKKSTLDEASFEPDYDESTSPESEPEVPGEEKNLLINLSTKTPSPMKKRSRSPSDDKLDKKKMKSETEEGKAVEKIVKEMKKAEQLESDDSSDSDSTSETSSDSSVETRKKHRKKKKNKKRKKKKGKKRRDSSSDSDSSDSSSSDSDSGKVKKKKHKHRSKKSKSSRKKKKSKHKYPVSCVKKVKKPTTAEPVKT